MKKITLATIKSFIKNNQNELYIKHLSNHSDGMVDDYFKKVVLLQEEKVTKYNRGIATAWFVDGSRNWFQAYEDDNFIGFEVYNCCCTFLLVIER